HPELALRIFGAIEPVAPVHIRRLHENLRSRPGLPQHDRSGAIPELSVIHLALRIPVDESLLETEPLLEKLDGPRNVVIEEVRATLNARARPAQVAGLLRRINEGAGKPEKKFRDGSHALDEHRLGMAHGEGSVSGRSRPGR